MREEPKNELLRVALEWENTVGSVRILKTMAKG